MASKLEQVEAWVHKAAEWRWVPIFLFLWTLFDFYTFFLPADAVYAAAILGAPRRVWIFSIAVISARVLGTVGFYYIAQSIPLETLFTTAQDYHLGDAWQKSLYFFERFGPPSLGFISAFPFPPMQIVIVLSAAAGVSLWSLQMWLIPGLAVKCAIIYWLVKSGIYMVEKSRKRKKN